MQNLHILDKIQATFLGICQPKLTNCRRI